MKEQIDQIILGEVNDDSADIDVLLYMAQIALDVLGQPWRPATLSRPHITHLQGITRNMLHHVTTFAYCAFNKGHLSFVGFLSRRNLLPSSLVNTSVADVDCVIVEAMMNVPGLLNYSSLRLSDGNWCNLVIFNEEGIASEEMVIEELSHHASYKLAPLYYQWIRIHHGSLTREGVIQSMTLRQSRYYTFEQPQTPTVTIHTYQEPVALQIDALVL